ncbi:MAG: SMC family ATPase [Planctomycetes bacterium]|nr:SMC family ATPase [Planctomycetota bacterium]
MRFQRLAISGFGPFAGTETIDFDRLSAAGLFLLAGPTGAGKTTLLDAICYALYGETTGEGLGQGPIDGRSGADLRSARARPDQLTEVELEFSVSGARYRVVRNPQYTRAPRRGTTPVTEPARAALHRHDAAGGGRWEPLAAKVRDVTARVEEITGFTAGQFRRVVVIPQGRFRDVLVSTPAVREELLERIFGTAVYEAFEELVAKRAKEAGQALEALAAERGRLLADAEGLGDLDDAAVAVRLAADLDTGRAAAVAAKGALDKVTADHDASARALGAAGEVEALVRGVADAERALVAATAALDDLRPARDELVRAEAAAEPERLRQASAELDREVGSAAKEVETADVRLAAATDVAAVARGRLAAATTALEAVEGIDRRLGVIAEQLAAIATLRESHAAAGRALAAADTAVAIEREAEATAAAAATRASATADSAADALREARRLHAADAAGRLAALLAADAPCPVCGSRHHPAPARPQPGAPDDAAVDTLDEALAKAVQRRDQLVSAAAAAVAARVEAEGREGAARASRDALPALPEGESLQRERGDLGAWRGRLVADQSAATAEVATAEGEVRLLRERRAAAVERQQTLTRQAADAACALAAALAASPFATEGALAEAVRPAADVAALRKQITGAEQQATTAREVLADRRTRLGGRTAPDLPALRAAHDALSEKRQEALVADEQARSTVSWLESLVASHADFAARQARVGPAALAAHRLHQMVTGQAHAVERLSLHRWVLGAVLEQVVAHATVILRQMTRGRYELVRAEPATRSVAAGLDIDVLDHWTGTCRGARTLSGGETFLASLALSLALAKTAEEHQGGRRLETVFIDEGFGALDAETLEYALVALQGLRAEGRVVGVISHVEEMQRSIPVQLRLVRHGDDTTTTIVGTP